MLLWIPSEHSVRRAVDAASAFLVYRRRNFLNSFEIDEVLGIWIRGSLDATLPWLSPDSALDAEVRSANRGEQAVGILESFSFSGLWSLCRIDGASYREARTVKRRRFLLLHALAQGGETQPGSFVAVFDASEIGHGLKAMRQELRAYQPRLASPAWFIDDRERGLIEMVENR